ncbi:MAG TPA: tautomerase family protein, partial [Mycobacterium sp.]
QHDRYELIYDRTFMGGPRTDGFVMIRVVAGKERSVEVKQTFFKAVVDNLSNHADVAPEDVFIILDTVDLTDFSVAGGRPFDPPHLRRSNG